MYGCFLYFIECTLENIECNRVRDGLVLVVVSTRPKYDGP